MSKDLETFLVLERTMLELDEIPADIAAEELRDMMDPIWYRLSAEERASLNSRDMASRFVDRATREKAIAELFGIPSQPNGWNEITVEFCWKRGLPSACVNGMRALAVDADEPVIAGGAGIMSSAGIWGFGSNKFRDEALVLIQTERARR